MTCLPTVAAAQSLTSPALALPHSPKAAPTKLQTSAQAAAGGISGGWRWRNRGRPAGRHRRLFNADRGPVVWKIGQLVRHGLRRRLARGLGRPRTGAEDHLGRASTTLLSPYIFSADACGFTPCQFRDHVLSGCAPRRDAQQPGAARRRGALPRQAQRAKPHRRRGERRACGPPRQLKLLITSGWAPKSGSALTRVLSAAGSRWRAPGRSGVQTGAPAAGGVLSGLG